MTAALIGVTLFLPDVTLYILHVTLFAPGVTLPVTPSQDNRSMTRGRTEAGEVLG